MLQFTLLQKISKKYTYIYWKLIFMKNKNCKCEINSAMFNFLLIFVLIHCLESVFSNFSRVFCALSAPLIGLTSAPFPRRSLRSFFCLLWHFRGAFLPMYFFFDVTALYAKCTCAGGVVSFILFSHVSTDARGYLF